MTPSRRRATTGSTLVLAGCAVLCGCAHARGGRGAEPARAATFLLEAESSFETSLAVTPADGEPAVRYRHVRRWDGVLEQGAGGSFVDGSTATNFWFSDLEAAVGDGGPPADAVPSPLEAIPLGLRHFADREILGFIGLESWSGAPRGGDLLLPLWPSLSPHVPAIGSAGTAARRVNLPLLLGDGRGVVVALELNWTRGEGPPPPDLPPSLHLRYAGLAKGSGVDAEADWRARVSVAGPVEGDLWLDEGDASVLRATFTWDLVVDLAFAEDRAGSLGGRVSQRQHHTGTLVRRTSPAVAPGPGVPEPRELTPAAVLEVLHAADPQFSACIAEDPGAPAVGSAGLWIAVGGAGQVREAGVTGGLEAGGLASCLQRAACALAFPPGSEPETRWTYTVAWRAGDALPFPSVAAVDRPRGPILLDPSLPSDGPARLAGILGEPETPGSAPATTLPCPGAALPPIVVPAPR